MKICLIDETGTGDGALSVLAARWGLEHDEDNLMALVLTPEHLELRKRDEPKLGGIFVDFVGGAMAHRRKFGGGRGEAVAKAVGIKGDYLPDVVDATTHVLSSSVAGTMVVDGGGLQRKTVTSILMAWVFTLPAAVLLSGGLYWLSLQFL